MVSWDELREKIQDLAEKRGDWAGYPIPIDNLELRLAPSFPYQELANTQDKIEHDTYEHVNTWHSYRFGCDVSIIRNKNTNRVMHVILPYAAGEKLTYSLNSMHASRAWDSVSEIRAMITLSDMIPKHSFDYYLLTGGFLETSERSGVTYYFRKLKPTIALKKSDDDVRIMTTLCLHPIGYYNNSFAGCMVPTDDVIAHLQMMRGDEHKFWAKANHHPSYSPCSGI